MNRAFLDLLARFPAMLAAFESLPDYDQRALCEGLRGCVTTTAEDDALAFMNVAGLIEGRGGSEG